MRALVAISMFIALASCKSAHDLYLSPSEPIKVSVKSTGEGLIAPPSKEQVIAPGTPKHQKFLAWVAENREGWEWSPATYVPGELVVSGNRYTFNFSKGGVILNYESKPGKYEQLVKKVDPETYDFLRE